ncbi:MAG: hypothetical protein U0893_11685 [Chloroflexota bacterium]
MSETSILPPDSELYRRLHEAAREQRWVFFAGLPGVGKSLLLQQLALLATQAGRSVSLLQWDVARGPFETPAILACYPEVDGVTHAVIRKAAGVWARDAVGQWDQQHPSRSDILIGEVPLIGNRLIELVQRQDDRVEELLAGEQTLFLIPVPSREVRQAIEAARIREMADPQHDRERANAVPSLVDALWQEVATVARALGMTSEEAPSPNPSPVRGRGRRTACSLSRARGRGWGGGQHRGFDPDVYAAVYQHLLRHRHAERLDVTSVLPVRTSVYDALGAARDLLPDTDDVRRVMDRVSARPEADVDREVADWFRV